MFSSDLKSRELRHNPESTEKLLQEIAGVDAQKSWCTYLEDRSYGLTVSLPHACSISGTLNIRKNEQNSLYIDMLVVPEALQRKSIGTRLLREFILEAVKYDATWLVGHVTSIAALRTLAKVCGKDNLEFFDRHTSSKKDVNYEQVVSEAARSQTDRLDIFVRVDLRNIEGFEFFSESVKRGK